MTYTNTYCIINRHLFAKTPCKSSTEMIIIKCINHILFCVKNKTISSSLSVYDFIMTFILFVFMISSFFANNIYEALTEYSCYIIVCVILLYLISMLLSVFQKIPKDRYLLYKYLNFSNIDFIILIYCKTFITNIMMSVSVANFLVHWQINFWLSFAFTLIVGGILVFCVYMLMSENQKTSSRYANRRKCFLSNLFFKNKYTAYFYKAFFGYPKGCYEYIDIFISLIFLMCAFYFGLKFNIYLPIIIYSLNLIASAAVIDVYSLEYKSKNLSLVLNIKNKQIFKMTLVSISVIAFMATILYLLIFSLIYGFCLIDVATTVAIFLYFIPIQYSLILTANKKLNANLSIMSAFIPDIFIALIPVINIIRSVYIIIKNTKEL